MLTRSLYIVVPISLLCDAAGWQAHATSINPRSWANFLSPVTDHDPPSEKLVKNGVEISKPISQGKATRIRKMSGNENEMFFPHFWTFEPVGDAIGEGNDLGKRESTAFPDALNSSVYSSADWSNASVLYPLQAPLALHGEQQIRKDLIFGRFSRGLLHRDTGFKCPNNSSDCSSIGRPNSCCSNGLICQLIEDSGQGDVGCCAEGETCNGAVQCAPGYSGCPGAYGGGCCLPGFQCYGIGCAKGSTITVVIDPTVTASPTSTSTSTLSTTSDIPTDSTNPGVVPAPVPTTTSSASPPPTTFTTPSISTPSSSHTSSSSSSDTLIPPVRPTSLGTATVTNSVGGTCPTGFYQCSAFYHAGCCRYGRNCSLSDCPATASTTVANTHGVTIIAPTGNGIGAATVGSSGSGSCATGWSSCAASLGGGCCPSGYGCGAGPSCMATQAAETASTIAKETPTSASGSGGIRLANPHYWLVFPAICTIVTFF